MWRTGLDLIGCPRWSFSSPIFTLFLTPPPSLKPQLIPSLLLLIALAATALAQTHHITAVPYTVTDTGVYVLDNSVVGTIQISASNVTLDLGGNTLVGSVVATHVMRVVIQNGILDSGAEFAALDFNNVVSGKVSNLVLTGGISLFDCSGVLVGNNSIIGMPPAIYSGLSPQGTSSRLANSFQANSVSVWPTVAGLATPMTLSPFDAYSSNMFPGFPAGVTPVTGGVKQ